MHRLSFVLSCSACLVACGTRIEVAAAPDSGAPPHDGSAPMDDEPDVTPTFATGVFDCTSSLSASGSYSGEKYVSVAGGNGTLTLTQSGDVVTAAYTDDTFLSGTLRFRATTDGSAEPAGSGQSVTILCFAPFGMWGKQSVSVASGSLTMDATTLFLSFSGTAEPDNAGATPCDGVTIPGTLVCEPHEKG
jgi:hypothetical protein